MMGNLNSLQYLNLSQNQLGGLIPPTLGSLINLQQLYLDHNPLSGSLPQELINLTNLNTFYFHETCVGVPSDAGLQTWLAGIADLKVGKSCVYLPVVLSDS